MFPKYFLHLALTIVLLTTGFTASLSNVAVPLQTQDTTQAVDSPGLVARLAAIEKAIDARRRQLGIPGVSLVIVKDDKVIYLKGLGLKNVALNLPVTPDTLFAIGSAGKAFTAMSVVMTADEAKLSLDDSPQKLLPYFQMQDPEADAKIAIRDLLCHRSGLHTTNLALRSYALNREEMIQVVAMAKPTARLRVRFQYQNVMYAAAGEIVAKAQKTAWEDFIVTRIFKPLGMKASTLNVKDMEKSPDYSYGYEHDFVTNETRRLPMQDLSSMAPAGSINSSAREMAAWLRLMLGGGVFEGKHTSMVTTATVDFENQGFTGEATISAKAPNLSVTNLTLMALGKKIGALGEYFDGARGAEEESFAPAKIKTGKSLEAARIEADFYGLLNWKNL